jgi:hypothetical protein
MSVAVAFATVLVARKELQQNRAYNKTSIRPMLMITKHFGGSQGAYGIAVKNAGLGPAIIMHCKVLINSNEMDEKDGDHGWNTAINKLGLEAKMRLNKSTIAPDGKLAHGDRIWLLYIDEKSLTKENVEELQSAIKNYRLDIKIDYESLAGDKFTESFLK